MWHVNSERDEKKELIAASAAPVDFRRGKKMLIRLALILLLLLLCNLLRTMSRTWLLTKTLEHFLPRPWKRRKSSTITCVFLFSVKIKLPHVASSRRSKVLDKKDPVSQNPTSHLCLLLRTSNSVEFLQKWRRVLFVCLPVGLFPVRL